MWRYRWRARAATTFVVCVLTLGAAASGWAANQSLTCRLAIAKASSKVTLTGYKDSLACRKAADKAGQATGPCDVPGSSGFDPKGSYASAKSNGMTAINAKCPSGEPVLGNYDNNDPVGAVFPEIEGALSGNQLGTAGNENLSMNNPPDLAARVKCVEAIVKAEAGIVKEIVLGGTKCQKAKDKTASSFGPLDSSCLLTGTNSVPKATAAINKVCTGLDPAAIGTCSPLPDCATSNTVTAAQDIVQAIYFKKAAASTCGNGIVESGEQCDDGANNGQPGDLCNAKCESLAETCGPGTTAGGTITGHRIVTVSLGGIPASPPSLAGVQVNFAYPQLEASIPGTGASSVVRGTVQVFPTGGLLAVNDTDTDFHFALASTTEFIGGGPLFRTTLDECVPVSQNLCNRNPNVIGCCPLANLDTCADDALHIDDPMHFAAYYDDCQCGSPLKGVQLSDCTTNYKFYNEAHGSCTTPPCPCTAGACASPPSTIKCGHGCTAGGSNKLNHACATAADCFDAGICNTTKTCTSGGSDKLNGSCTADADCFDPGTCDTVMGKCTGSDPAVVGNPCTVDADCDSAAGVCSAPDICTAGEPTKIGSACTMNSDCDSAAGVCSSSNICTAGDPGRIGLACSINNDCGTPLTVATCEACPQLGDRNNGTFGCSDVYNGPICKPGAFPAQAVGGCDGTANGPLGGCPLGNVCVKQDEITTGSCSLINPVNHLGQPVDGVTCSIDIMEAP